MWSAFESGRTGEDVYPIQRTSWRILLSDSGRVRSGGRSTDSQWLPMAGAVLPPGYQQPRLLPLLSAAPSRVVWNGELGFAASFVGIIPLKSGLAQAELRPTPHSARQTG
jgi:hypothetical protein